MINTCINYFKLNNKSNLTLIRLCNFDKTTVDDFSELFEIIINNKKTKINKLNEINFDKFLKLMKEDFLK
jgi:hypothetical protein